MPNGAGACPPRTGIWHAKLPPELLALQLHQHARLTDHQSVYLTSGVTFLLRQLSICQYVEGPVG